MSAPESRQTVNYEQPPARWPFPSIGRTAFVLLGLLLLGLTLLPFWGSIAVAAIFAFGLHGIVAKFARKLGNRRRLTAAIFVSALTLLLLMPATLFGLRIYQLVATQGSKGVTGAFSPDTLQKLSVGYGRAENLLAQYGTRFRVFETEVEAREGLRSSVSSLLGQGMNVLSSLLVSLPQIVVSMLVFGLFLYTFMAYPREIRRFALRLNVFRPSDLKRSVRILTASSYNSLVANFFVGILQATIITLGAWFVGYGESVLIFSVVFLVSYIPFLGSAPVGYLLALLCLFTDGLTPCLIMAAVATFAGVIDNVVRPYLVSYGGTEVHPVLSFASILGAIGIFGLKGIFLGPVILTATVALLGPARKSRLPSDGAAGVVRALERRRKALRA